MQSLVQLTANVHIIFEHTSLVSASKLNVQVVKKNTAAFLEEMNAKAIASKLRLLSWIPESVEYDINNSKSREDANGHLLTFLTEQASESQLQGTFKVASEKTDYGRMSQFAANILQQLQKG